MRWITVLERRFGHLAVPGLMRIVVALNACIFILLKSRPEFLDVLTLRPDRVMAGEVWRLFSYVLIPQVAANPGEQFDVIWLFFYLNMLWLIGEGLEQAWGSFKLNLFYLIGMLGTTIAVVCFGLGDATGLFLNYSLVFAFATLFPNYPLMIFFVLPVRVKWIALFTLIFVGLSMAGGTAATRLAILVSLANYLIFFGPTWLGYWREQGRTAVRRQQFQIAVHQDAAETLHHCKVCDRTEVSSPELDFRVAGDGEEYCLAHLPSRRDAVDVPPPLPGSEGA